jgi:hypothetical protein
MSSQLSIKKHVAAEPDWSSLSWAEDDDDIQEQRCLLVAGARMLLMMFTVMWPSITAQTPALRTLQRPERPHRLSRRRRPLVLLCRQMLPQ